MVSSDVKYYPWPSTVNVANFVTVKPCPGEDARLTTFNIWKEQMLCLVESQDVLGFINGEILEPQKLNSESSSNVKEYDDLQKLWRRTDKLVKGWILGSIGKEALDAVWDLQTAREVWLKLDEIFSQKAERSEIQSESDANAHAEGGESKSNPEIQPESHANAPQESGESKLNSELQPESDANAHKEGGESGDLSKYLPLYKAAMRGDWEAAKSFFDKDEEGTKSIMGSFSETALHVGVETGKANDFVKKLVDLMPHDALTLKNQWGNTALHNAAAAGNTEAAMTLVSKNPDLLYILNNDNQLPVGLAAIRCHKDTLKYLISMSKPNVEHSPFEGQLGVGLLVEAIGSEFFDIALDLAEKYPDLARRGDKNRVCGLLVIAGRSSVFPSAESFTWWQKLIYRRVPLSQRKLKAAQAISVSGDIENVSRDVSANKEHSSSFQIIISGVTQKLEFTLWKVIEHLVPQVKGIRDKKAVHQQALELVKCLCQQMVSLPENEASSMFSDSIIRAAKCGISEIVEMIIEMYPKATFAFDQSGMNVFLLAASQRFENVFNLIYNMSDRKYGFFGRHDHQRNNLMHMCGKIAPPDRLNLVPGAALQMQRELQWFKEMENFVHPSRRIWTNRQNQSPQMLFTKEHQQLKADGEKWMKDTANACTIAAALIATVVFAAVFTVPGGVATETGIPIFSDQFAFVLFAISDAVSLFTSILSLLMFLSILTSRYAEEDFLYVLPKRLSIGLFSLFISITFMMVAFSATLYLVFRRKMAWFLIPVAAFACLPVTSFVLLQFPLLVDVVYSTYGPGIFGKKSDRLLY